MLETEFVIVACLKSFSKELEVFQMKEVSVKKLTLHWGGFSLVDLKDCLFVLLFYF